MRHGGIFRRRNELAPLGRPLNDDATGGIDRMNFEDALRQIIRGPDLEAM